MPKGVKGFQKGYKQTEEHKENRKLSMVGKVVSKETREKMSMAHKGKSKPHSEESKKKMSISRKGRTPWNKGIGTKTADSKKMKSSKEYVIFRKACFERDNYTCVFCGEKGKVLNMDHIKPFSLFQELRMALDNVRTLCHPCHKKTDTYGWKFYHNKKQIYG